MLSDEEKKAIENLKGTYWYVGEEGLEENIKTVLNLIEKQSKEIEELKKKTESQPDCVEPIERTEEMVNVKWVNHNYISKDKIKAKIEEAKKNYNDLHTRHLRDCGIAEQRELAKIEFGQSLLEKE